MWTKLILNPLGYVLHFLYQFGENYGIAILLFTLAIRIILLPLALKQHKSMKLTQLVQPKMLEIQTKYKDNQEKMTKEMTKLYKEYGYNPLSGCLPMIIQLPILFGLYQVLYKPITFVLRQADKIPEYLEKLSSMGKVIEENQMMEINIANELNLLDFSLFGLDFINIAESPSFSEPSLLWIFPILAALSTWLYSKVNMANQPQTAQQNDTAGGTMKMMNTFMPIMTGLICFSVPAALGLYWTLGNVIMMVQQLLLNRFYKVELPSGMVIEAEKPGVPKPKKKHKK